MKHAVKSGEGAEAGKPMSTRRRSRGRPRPEPHRVPGPGPRQPGSAVCEHPVPTVSPGCSDKFYSFGFNSV